MPLPPPAEDRTCVVTGASSGIGAEIARQLAAAGHGVTLVARRRDRLESLAKELGSTVRAEFVAVDLADPDARAGLPAELDRLGLTPDVLVNNAGFGTAGPVRTAERGSELAMVRTNVEAVVDLCTLFVAGMADRGRGAVLNVASTAAFQPLPGQAGYAASKAFVLSYTHALRAELAGTGVTVTALCPGPVATEFFDRDDGLTHAEASTAMPKAMWVPADKVAAAGLKGLAAGRAVVIPGPVNRIGAVAGRATPWSAVAAIVARAHPAVRR